MSRSLGIPAVAGGPTGMAVLAARLAVLDGRLRTVDASWQGLGPPASTIQAAAAGGGFAGVLGSETATGRTWAPVAAGSVDGSGAAADTEFLDPIDGAEVTQPFGPTSLAIEPAGVVDGTRYAHFHDGLDLAAPLGTPVHAAAAGVVVAAGRQSDGAVVIRIRHGDGSQASYGHLEPEIAVREGDRVIAGQAIGTVGLTGRTTGPHLHLELVADGRATDPAPWIAAGRLPGAAAGRAAGGSPAGTDSPDELAAFDAVAGRIPYAAEIRDAAVKAGVDPLLLASLVRAESGFRPDAVSSAGALGLAQLMPPNVRSLGVDDPFDPAQNVTAAARYLANNLHLYGRADIALAAYQSGKGSVARAGGIPASPTTHRYIDRILGFWAGYLDSAGPTAEVVG